MQLSPHFNVLVNIHSEDRDSGESPGVLLILLSLLLLVVVVEAFLVITY